jgi:hypothetical protein
VLAVIDGSKALAKAIRDVYGVRALIQRCQAHKSRNVLDQLPEDARSSVRQALRDAYGSADVGRAKKLLTNLARRLRDEHPGAAASLEEGLDETLTVKRLGLPSKLERQLSTTNCVGDGGHRPAHDHPAAAPPLHAARELADRSHEVLDRDALPPYHRRARRHDRARAGSQGSRERACDCWSRRPAA